MTPVSGWSRPGKCSPPPSDARATRGARVCDRWAANCAAAAPSPLLPCSATNLPVFLTCVGAQRLGGGLSNAFDDYALGDALCGPMLLTCHLCSISISVGVSALDGRSRSLLDSAHTLQRSVRTANAGRLTCRTRSTRWVGDVRRRHLLGVEVCSMSGRVRLHLWVEKCPLRRVVGLGRVANA